MKNTLHSCKKYFWDKFYSCLFCTWSRLKQMLRLANMHWCSSVLQLAVWLSQDALCFFSLIVKFPLKCNISAVFLQGMYIKSTYDGLHVITGTTEGVSTSLFVCAYVPHCSFICSVICRVRWLYHSKLCHGSEIEQQVMTRPLCLPISPWLTAVRKSMLEMKSFRSIIKQW